MASITDIISSVSNFLSGIPATSAYSAVVSTGLAIERVIVGYVKKDWHPSLNALRSSLAAFIAPKTTNIKVIDASAPTASSAATTTSASSSTPSA